jgi:predicted ABC-type exoprotein transport system permease subunit
MKLTDFIVRLYIILGCGVVTYYIAYVDHFKWAHESNYGFLCAVVVIYMLDADTDVIKEWNPFKRKTIEDISLDVCSVTIFIYVVSMIMYIASLQVAYFVPKDIFPIACISYCGCVAGSIMLACCYISQKMPTKSILVRK